jgi:hypothetical protein
MHPDASDPLMDVSDISAISNAGELEGNAYELITVRSTSGEVRDYGFGFQDRSVLLAGSHLIDMLRTQPSITLIQGSADSWETQGA